MTTVVTVATPIGRDFTVGCEAALKLVAELKKLAQEIRPQLAWEHNGVVVPVYPADRQEELLARMSLAEETKAISRAAVSASGIPSKSTASFDIVAAISKSVAMLVEQGGMQAIIEKHVVGTVDDIIKSQVRSYSEFGNRIETAVEKALGGVEIEELPSYQQAITEAVRRRLEAVYEDSLLKPIEAQLGKLLAPAPKTIKLSELVEKFRSKVEKDRQDKLRDGCSCDDDDDSDEIGFEVEHSESLDGYKQIALSASAATMEWDFQSVSSKRVRKPKKWYEHDFRIMLDKENRVYGLSIKDAANERSLFVVPDDEFAVMLLQLRLQGTKIEFDKPVGSIDTSVYVGHD